MMHCEEIVQQAALEDSVAGLSRFLMAKFPCRVLKIHDPQSAEEAQNELDECFISILWGTIRLCQRWRTC